MLIALMVLGALLPNIEIGQDLSAPAQVAGPWEAIVAPREVVGFSLEIIMNANQRVRSLRLDTYVRKDGKTARTYWSSGDPGAFVMRTGQLHFHQERSPSGSFDVKLDLTYDPDDAAWKGSFSDGFFSGRVVLHRPGMRSAAAPAGTWRTYSGVLIGSTSRVNEYGCLNIGVGLDGTLVLWAEDHNLFLGFDKAKHPLVGDSYGALYGDSNPSQNAGEWTFLAGTSLSGERITGILSSDGSAFGGYSSDHYGNGHFDPSHPRRAFVWTRMLDFACRP